MRLNWISAAGIAAVVLLTETARAATYDLSLTGDPSSFTENTFQFDGQTFQQYTLGLSGLNSTNAITVAQGDTINSNVDFSNTYTIPASQSRTDLLQYLNGSSFPSENTQVSGTFNYYENGALQGSYGYTSSTSGSLASFAALFPPNNSAISFNSYTNDFTISDLATPATLDSSAFAYDLVSPGGGGPEPSSWALMMVGVFGAGIALRRQRGLTAAALAV